MTDEPDVAVIVVNWNTRELLRACLQSIDNGLRDGHTAEIWVVDNASEDGSVEMLRTAFPAVKLIANDENIGFARANNLALRQACGRTLLLLNSDCKVLSGAISALIDFLDTHPQAGMAGCRLLNGDDTVQRSAWKHFPTLGSIAVSGLWLDKIPLIGRRLAQEERIFSHTTKPVSVAHLLGACLMAKREAIAQVGLMDEAYFMYLEETDWCRRILAAGWEVWYLPSPAMIHYGQQSAALAPDKATADWCRSICRFYQRMYGASRFKLSLLKATIAASVVLRFLVAQLRRGKTRPTWRGTGATLRALREA